MKGVVLLSLSFCLVGGIASIVQAATASQFSKKLTNPDDVMAGGVIGKVDLHLKNVEGIAKVTKNKMAAYYSKSLAGDSNDFRTKSSMKLKITKGRDSGYCKIPNSADGRITVRIAGRIMFNKPTSEVCSKFIGATISFPNNADFINNDSSGFFMAKIEVELTGHSKTPGEMGGDTDGYSLNYAMELVDSYGGKSKLALQGQTTSREFGFRSSYRSNPPSNRQVKSGVVFGFPCEIDPTRLRGFERVVKLYDPDPVFGMTYMWIEKDGHPLNNGDYDPALRDRIQGWDNTNKRWIVQPGNETTATIGLKARTSTINVKSEYRLVVLNTGKNANGSNSGATPHGNTLSFSIPFDSIYGADKCNYDLRPTVNPPANSSNTIPVGATVSAASVVGNIIPDGFDDDSHAWRLTARAYKDRRPNLGAVADSTLDPCSWRTGTTGPACATKASGTDPNGFGSRNFSRAMSTGYDTSSLEAGDWVCFMMSVKKPTYNSSGGTWRHSALKCIGITGASPGVSVDPATYSYFPNLQITADIRNEGGYPKVDRFNGGNYKRNGYDWKLIEAKFSKMPSSIGTSDNGGCNTVRDVSGFLNGSCEPIEEGNNLFPNSGNPSVKSGTNFRKGPDPIGTWTCYTFSYRTNPGPSQALRSAIQAYVTEQNNPPYRYWIPPVRDEDGKIIEPGHWNRPKIKFNDIYGPYEDASPAPSPAKYKFTPYEQDSCSQSGIDPKVQIRGNDLKVNGSITTSVRTMEVGNAIGSYGSGGEYGVLSGGQNSGFASGSGMLRGLSSADQGSWSTLTFTNNNPAGGYGNFNSVPTQNVQLSDGGIPYDGRTTFNSGEKIIYQKVAGTLVINSNLTYANTYSRVGQIPRVIISADNIEIGPNVTRIDTWLIADNISTCGPPRGAGWGASASMAMGNADLRTGECNKPLIFNGPVYAANLYLYRTGGSRIPKDDLRSSWANPDAGIDPSDYCEGNDCRYEASMSSTEKREARQYMLSAPAEVFNLRPDVFLSSFAGASTGNPVATTDKVTELPPRF